MSPKSAAAPHASFQEASAAATGSPGVSRHPLPTKCSISPSPRTSLGCLVFPAKFYTWASGDMQHLGDDNLLQSLSLFSLLSKKDIKE